MIWNLIGTLVLGVAAASVVMIAFRALRRPVPRWLLPAAAGAAMLTFHIWSDYTWYGRTVAELPERVVVAQSHTSSHPLQPWTLVVPRIDRFSAVDRAEIRRNKQVPEMVMALVYLVTRWYPTVGTLLLYDCAIPRRADVGETLEKGPGGRPVEPNWVTLEPDDAVRRVVCAEA